MKTRVSNGDGNAGVTNGGGKGGVTGGSGTDGHGGISATRLVVKTDGTDVDSN